MGDDQQHDAAADEEATHAAEPHVGHSTSRLNRLRAAVLGANDGIVSVAGIVVGWPGPPYFAVQSSRPGWRPW
jgi:hypothetical protein